MSNANHGRMVYKQTQTVYNRSNAVRKQDIDYGSYDSDVERQIRRSIKEVPYRDTRTVRGEVRKSLLYLMLFVCALMAVGYVLYGYIGLRSDINRKIETISSKEILLNDLIIENDEEYTRLMSSVDLNEINRIARQELGMVNPTSEQVVVISGETNDYVKQEKEVEGN